MPRLITFPDSRLEDMPIRGLARHEVFALAVAIAGLTVVASTLLSVSEFPTLQAMVWAILLTIPVGVRIRGLSGGQVAVITPILIFGMLLSLGVAPSLVAVTIQVVVGHLLRATSKPRSEETAYHDSPESLSVAARLGNLARAVDPWRTAFNTGQIVLTVFSAALVLRLALPGSGADFSSRIQQPSVRLFAALLLASLTYRLVNTVLVSTVIAMQSNQSFQKLWRSNHRWSMPQALWIPVGGFVLASLYSHQLWFPFAIVYASELCATRLGAAIMRLRALLEQTIDVLRTILLKTAPHLETETDRIRTLALKLADRLRVGPFERAALEKAIPLLNMGYVGVEKHILLKKPAWEAGDREQMLRHPIRGARILSKTHHLKEAARLVAMHHERIDGSGYPRGLEGPDIPLGARILGTVEAYVGMTSERPHREPMTDSQAIKELRTSGHDTRVVRELAQIEDVPVVPPVVTQPTAGTHRRRSWWRQKRRQLRDLIYYPSIPEATRQATPPRWLARALFVPIPVLFVLAFVTSADALRHIDYHSALWLSMILASATLAPVFLRRGATLSAVMGCLVAAVLLLPPGQVLVFSLVAGTILGAWEIGRRRLPTSGFSLASGVLAATAVYQVLQGGYGSPILFQTASGPVHLLPAVAAALSFGIAAAGSASMFESVVQRLSPARIMMGSYLPFLPETLLYLLGGIVMAAMYSLFGPLGAALALIYPLLDLHFDIWHQNQLERSYTELLEAEAAAIDEKDSYTRGHSQRVSTYAMAVAREIGLTESQVNLVEEGGFEHDIGKIAWENGMLMRPDKLTSDEEDLMRKHPGDGAEIAQKMGAPQPVVDMIYHHHEMHDGSGFPNGLTGRSIPLGARILHVVDAFDAMTSGRPYQTNKSIEEAVQELRDCAGSDFDPDVVNAFERALAKGRIFLDADIPQGEKIVSEFRGDSVTVQKDSVGVSG